MSQDNPLDNSDSFEPSAGDENTAYRTFSFRDTKASPSSPYCYRMSEHPSAAQERDRLLQGISSPGDSPLSIHLSHGLAYTVGSALGSTPPSTDACLAAFVVPNAAGLTAGARAWSKHAHRSGQSSPSLDREGDQHVLDQASADRSKGWWGSPSGPVARINERALTLFWKTMNGATWRNLHWLPHSVLVYEVRVAEGYGMRWSQNRSMSSAMIRNADNAGHFRLGVDEETDITCLDTNQALDVCPWVFRGFVEPMMEKGHELGWRH